MLGTNYNESYIKLFLFVRSFDFVTAMCYCRNLHAIVIQWFLDILPPLTKKNCFYTSKLAIL